MTLRERLLSSTVIPRGMVTLDVWENWPVSSASRINARLSRVEAILDEFYGARLTIREPAPDRLDDVTL